MNSLSRPERGWKRGGTSGWKHIYMSLRQLPRAKTKSESNIDTGAQFCRNLKAFVCRINPQIVFYRLYYHILNSKLNITQPSIYWWMTKKNVCICLYFPITKQLPISFSSRTLHLPTMTKLLLNTGHDITRLDWPGNSPELKLIEALWVIVKKAEGRKVTVGFISQERELNVPKMKKKWQKTTIPQTGFQCKSINKLIKLHVHKI